jgi:hypothetical protein
MWPSSSLFSVRKGTGVDFKYILISRAGKIVMKLETRVFELCNGKYTNLSELAKAMGLNPSHVYRVRQGKRGISHKFIIGAVKAFPGYKLDDLFYVVPEGSQNDR